jgi:uncharacterized protein GlcG (DUF336 family)
MKLSNWALDRGVKMNTARLATIAGVVFVAAWHAADAAGAVLPGDRGRPFDGVLPASVAAQAPAAARVPTPQPLHLAPAIPIDLAVKAARAVDVACKQYPLGVAITDAEGVAKLIYVPNRSESWHGYSAVRKAYTAITFNMATSALMKQVVVDPAVGAQVRADPNLMAFSGALLLRVHDRVVGALAVSGAEPGGHDEECALAGVRKISKDLR